MMRALTRQLAFFLLNLIALRWLISLLPWAESSLFWSTGTTGDGTSTYTEAQLTAFYGDAFTPNTTITTPSTSGVLPHAGGELAVSGASSPVSVASGAAITEGYAYRNTAAVTVAIPTPASATRIDRIVLRVSHSTTRTVRITRIAGTEGSGSAPAVTSNAGVTWDIKLAQVSITTGGVITVTDERPFCHFATRVDKSDVDGGTAGFLPFFDPNGRLTQDATNGPYYDDANNRLGLGTATPTRQIHVYGANQATANPTDAGNKDSTLYLQDSGAAANNGGAILFGAVQGFWGIIKGLLFDGANNTMGDIVIALRSATANTSLTEMFRFGKTGQLTITPPSAAAPIILGTNAQGQKVASLNADQIDGLDLAFNRQGAAGSGGLWASPGTSNFTPTVLREQVGVATFSGIYSAGGSYNLGTVTFPVAFNGTPIVTCSSLDFGVGVVVSVGSVSSTTVTFYLYAIAPVGTVTINWIAKGPA